MSDRIMITVEGLTEAKGVLDEVAAAVSEAAEHCDTQGTALQGVWLGVGSSSFKDSHALIHTFMDKISAIITSEAGAVMTANTRFQDVDAAEATRMTGLSEAWVGLFGE